MPRLFVAAWPPEHVLDVIARLPRPEVPGLRWSVREHWHVTLRFLGAVDDAAPVVGALAEVGRLAPVGAVLGPAVGRFGHRVLHVPVAGLDELAGRVVAATAGMGQAPGHRSFTGHLTLARVSGGARVDLRPLAGRAVVGRWNVDEVCLVESRLSAAGARYEVLERVPLAWSSA